MKGENFSPRENKKTDWIYRGEVEIKHNAQEIEY